MITWSKFHSATFDEAKHRILKIFQFGTKTADECMSFGDDSVPPQGWDAIYCETSNDDAPVILGYINTNQLAQAGEKRFYSIHTDPITGATSQAFYTWMKNDGTYEIGGAVDNLLRYDKLNIALQAHISKLQTQLTLIATGIATGGGSYTPGDISLDISSAKIDEIKCL